MLILFEPGARRADLARAVRQAATLGLKARPVPGLDAPAVAVRCGDRSGDPGDFEKLPGVRAVIPVSRPYPRAERRRKDTVIALQGGRVRLGGDRFTVIAGPCVVEDEAAVLRIARAVKKAGASILRGGAFKPRTSPYSFQGLGPEGLRILEAAREETGLPFVTEALDSRSLEAVARSADIIQIGARNMQNFPLLREAGRLRKPILLKRGQSATVDEWLMAAEYILAEGNPDVILCERGIRTMSGHTRNTVDLNAVCIARRLSHLPVFVDPSHGTGLRETIIPLSRAAAALPAHGIMVEVHDRPQDALCDGHQALPPALLTGLIRDLRAMAKISGYRM